ncbi:MAG: tetratricopeptide repeat protein [Flavobacteriales bacterium]
MKALVSFILFFSIYTAQAQTGSRELDSLMRLWNDESLADSARLEALDEIAWFYLYTNPDTAYIIAKRENELSLKKMIVFSHVQSFNTMGTTYWIRGDYEKAIECYQKGITISKKINAKRALSSAYNNLGLIYKEQGKYKKAIEYYNKSLIIRDKLNDTVGIATSFNNIGVIYYDLKDLSSALKYYKKALDLRYKIKDKMGIMSTLANIGGVQLSKYDTVQALDYFKKSLVICRELKNDVYTADMLNNIATVYYDLKKYDASMDYNKQSLEIREKVGDKSGIANSLVSMALNNNKTGNLTEARRQGEAALALAREVADPAQIEAASFVLHQVYKKTNNTAQALAMHELYIATRDSLLDKSNQEAAMRQMFDYEYDKQQMVRDAQHKATLKKQKAVAAEEEKRQSIIIWAVSIGFLLVVIFSIFLFNRFRVIRKQKETIALQKAEADSQKELVEEKNKEILDSIQYAKRLQTAILPPENLIKEWVPQSFVLFKPKDIVSGDFYWFEKIGSLLYFAAVDCTGHGVPGAMVSVVGHNGLNRALKEFNLRKPSDILDKLRELVLQTFEKSEQEVKDGMDVALCCIDTKTNTIQFAGANNPLWLCEKKTGLINEIRGDKQPVGKFQYGKPFTHHEIQLQKGDAVYIFSDGYADQFGGDPSKGSGGKKFKSSSMKILLQEMGSAPMSAQKEKLNSTFENWRGDLEQLDDVCVIGIRI